MSRLALTLYPAIDLKNGECVRLRQGDMASATHYSDDPCAQAIAFQKAGCRYLHVVDLDGAVTGLARNHEAIKSIVQTCALPVQLGGGIRSMASISLWLETGIRRVILGSAAVTDPELVKAACRTFPGQIAVGIDARHGRVATQGWTNEAELKVQDLAIKMQDVGVCSIIFTEITRDGMMSGIDIPQTVALAQALTIPVIASGGVGTLAHLQALRDASDLAPNIEGVIIGRALYENRFTLAQARQVLGEEHA